jgi:hypothetical protein
MPFTETATTYAALLQSAGFTVYAPVRDDRTVGWFHYSRTVDGQTCFGTFHDGSDSFDGPHHAMPITPSQLNGSSAITDQRCHPLTVRAALQTARPTNCCPVNYPDTAENRQLANVGRTPSRRAATGATLTNAEPWGIGTRYVPVA